LISNEECRHGRSISRGISDWSTSNREDHPAIIAVAVGAAIGGVELQQAPRRSCWSTTGRPDENNAATGLSAQIITPEDVAAVDTQLIEYVNRRRQETHLIIDSHPVTKEQYGFRITTFSIEKLLALWPTMICMLYAEPGVVMERINGNAQGRPMVNSFEAAFHSELQGAVAVTYGIVLGAPVYLLDSSKPIKEVANAIIRRLEAKNSSARRVL